ncbi:MAG: hypothetical protein AAGU75_18910 [Bacillota bacterium]
MKKYYKILILPAMIIIIAGIFSGFSEQPCSKTAQNLLEQRTKILQSAYYGKIEMKVAERELGKIETYPLLSEDLGNLKDADPAQIDIVKSMEFLEVNQEQKLFSFISFHMKIRWYMSGLDSDYISENEYIVVLKETRDSIKLSEFNPE